MIQLDLFGNPINNNPPSPKKEKKQVVPINNGIALKITEEKPIKTVLPKPAIIASIEPLEDEVVVSSTVKVKSKRGRKSYAEMYSQTDLENFPTDEELAKKMYYSISEVAKWFGVTNSQIRFWENEFDILKPRKNRKGDRLFRVEDIKNLKVIYYLLRHQKYSIEGAREYLKANKHTANVNIVVKDALTKLRAFLLEMKANLD